MTKTETITINSNYQKLISDIKDRISHSRLKAHFAVNKEMILLYWNIGNEILKRQKEQGWGSKVIDQISKDLRTSFPEMKGFGTRNLKYMRKFADEYKNYKFVQEVLAQLSWYHHITLLDKKLDEKEKLFYINYAIETGVSRNAMLHQIDLELHKRQGSAVTNFSENLPSPQSDLAQNILKDPYCFDCLSNFNEIKEKDIEGGLVKHIEKFLIELGKGFTYVGRQYHLEVGGQDFYIDLLFYHLELRCFIVVEIKNTPFKPEYAGKLNFYLSAIDDKLKKDTDKPSIGLILCKTKNNIQAEYALRDMSKPIALAKYNLAKSLPDEIKSSLPTIEEIELGLGKKIS